MNDEFRNPEDIIVAAMEPTDTLFGHTVSDLQTDLFAGNGKIVGTLSKVTSGALAAGWGEGYFMALKFAGPAFNFAKAIYVGLEPSVSSGLANILNDPDRNGSFKVTNKIQNFKVVVDYGMHKKIYLYDLSGLTLSD